MNNLPFDSCPIDISDENIFEAMKEIRGYLDKTAIDEKPKELIRAINSRDIPTITVFQENDMMKGASKYPIGSPIIRPETAYISTFQIFFLVMMPIKTAMTATIIATIAVTTKSIIFPFLFVEYLTVNAFTQFPLTIIRFFTFVKYEHLKEDGHEE
jgi:hypothetical protein